MHPSHVKRQSLVQLVLIYYLFPFLAWLLFSQKASDIETDSLSFSLGIFIIIACAFALFFSLKRCEDALVFNNTGPYKKVAPVKEQEEQEKKPPIQANLIEELQNQLEQAKEQLVFIEEDLERTHQEKQQQRIMLLEQERRFKETESTSVQREKELLELKERFSSEKKTNEELHEKIKSLTFELHTLLGVVPQKKDLFS